MTTNSTTENANNNPDLPAAEAQSLEAAEATQLALGEVASHLGRSASAVDNTEAAEGTFMAHLAVREMGNTAAASALTTSRAASIVASPSINQSTNLISQAYGCLHNALSSTAEAARAVFRVLTFSTLTTETTINSIAVAGRRAANSSSEAAIAVSTASQLLHETISGTTNENLSTAIRQNSTALMNTALAAERSASASAQVARRASNSGIGLTSGQINLEREAVQIAEQLAEETDSQAQRSVQLANMAVQHLVNNQQQTNNGNDNNN